MMNGDNQVILVMDEADAINFHKKGYAEPGCAVIPYNSECLPENDPLIRRLRLKNLLTPKNVLIKSPFGPEYYPLEEATLKVHIEYFKKYSMVCGLLGATRVKVTTCEINGEKTETSGGADVNVPGGLGGNISVKMASDSNTEALSKLEDIHEKKLDIAAAEKLMAEYGLEGDSDLRDLVAYLKNGGRLKTREMTLRLSQSLKTSFDLAAEIKPYAGIDIKLRFDRKKELKRTYTLTLSLQF